MALTRNADPFHCNSGTNNKNKPATILQRTLNIMNCFRCEEIRPLTQPHNQGSGWHHASRPKEPGNKQH